MQFFNKYQKFIFPLIFSFFILLAGYLLFINLGKSYLENWDEAFYGQTIKEMLILKNPIVLHWNYEVWFDKPPMFMWIVAFLSMFTGLSEFIIRFPSALLALIIILGSTLYVYRRYSLIPAIFTFFTLVLNNIFIWRARSGNLDLLATFLIFVSFLIQITKFKYKYPILGILFAFLYLAKASLVLFPLSIFIFSEIIFEYKNIKQNFKQYLLFIFCFVGIIAAWLFLGFLEAGSSYVNYYLFQSDQGVASLSKFNPNYIWHVYYSLQRRFFWLFLVGIFFAFIKLRNKVFFLLLSYALLLLLQLSLTVKDNNWYLVPAMPFWSILIGFGVYSLLNYFKKIRILYFVLILGLTSVSSYLWFRTLTINIMPILDSSSVVSQVKSAQKIKSLTKPNETIIRLDPLVSTTLYYSDRKTLSYFPNTNTRTYWINKEDLQKGILNKKYNWFVGTKAHLEAFYRDFDVKLFKEIKVNESEMILNLK